MLSTLTTYPHASSAGVSTRWRDPHLDKFRLARVSAARRKLAELVLVLLQLQLELLELLQILVVGVMVVLVMLLLVLLGHQTRGVGGGWRYAHVAERHAAVTHRSGASKQANNNNNTQHRQVGRRQEETRR